jgi:hypothetical protein
VRLLGLALLLFTLPQSVQLTTVIAMGMSEPHSSTAMMWPMALFLAVPIVAVVLILYARPIGRLIARGIE